MIGQTLLGRLMHPGKAMQSDDSRERPRALGLRQFPLDAVARNELAGNQPFRSAVEFHTLQPRGQRRPGAAKYQYDSASNGDCSGQRRLPSISAQHVAQRDDRQNCNQ
ncbi:MAG: hypothetical protein DI543_15730 [Bradyrhizobium icense]|nr:MAG: hypothetical protein DI543_15730 [Bradyrhizobium icense]